MNAQGSQPAANATERPHPVLIVAHPGHELLLHHWLERARPIVCTLTDGSGNQAAGRSDRSRHVIQQAGAQVGPVFSETTDRGWYEAILAGDRQLFDQAAMRIAEMCRAMRVTQIVADAFEFYNPMHDLCSCLAQNVSLRLRGIQQVELLTFPIERPDLMRTDASHVLELDAEALTRKFTSASEYLELSSEVARKRDDETVERFAVERLFPIDMQRESPRYPPETPYYERVGRDRLARGIYTDLITYETHVHPLATMLTRWNS
jgi:hypothetical protein